MLGYIMESWTTTEQIEETKKQFREVIEKRDNLEAATERLLVKYIRDMNAPYWYLQSAFPSLLKAREYMKKFKKANRTVQCRIVYAEFTSIKNASDYRVLEEQFSPLLSQ